MTLALRLDLYAGRPGPYGLEVESTPKYLSREYPFQSADLSLEETRPAVGQPDHTLTFVPEIPGPFGVDVLDRSDGLVYAHVYRPRSASKVFDLHRHNLATFTRFFHQFGDTCAGSFTVPELGPQWVAEWYSVDYPNRDTYWEAMYQVEIPMDIQRIVDAGRVLQTEASSRFFFWLTRHEPK